MKTLDGTRIRVKTDLIEWWALRIAQRIPADKVGLAHERLHSIIVRADTIYSFGSHFPMGVIVRNARGRAIRVLLNGDSGGARGWANTAGDQSDVRRSVRQVIDLNELDVQVLVVPFSATDAAGIERQSIVPVHVREDRYTYHEIVTAERPGPYAQVDTGETEEVEEERFGWFRPDGTPAPANTDAAWTRGKVKVERAIMREDQTKARVDDRRQHGHGWAEGYAELQSDGKWKYTVKRHWLGDSLIKGRSSETRLRNATAAERAVYDAYMAWDAERRRLHAAFSEAQSHFAYAQQAHVHGREMALEQGGPMVVPGAEDVARAEAARDAHVQAFNDHLHTEPPSNGVDRSGNRYVVRRTVRRWATYLSSFDYNEPRAPYFLCELPYSARGVKTIEEAIDALMPDDVRTAMAAGLNVLRQGDVFAVPTAYTTDELKSRAKQLGRRVYDVDAGEFKHHLVPIRSKVTDGRDAQVLGTNHAPTHMIATRDGQFFGRGRLYHTPDSRRPDHIVIELGDRQTWYRLVKNTVPMAQADANRRSMHGGWIGQTVNQSQSRAWMLGGAVD